MQVWPDPFNGNSSSLHATGPFRNDSSGMIQVGWEGEPLAFSALVVWLRLEAAENADSGRAHGVISCRVPVGLALLGLFA
jgi:hypothetical protein